MIIRWIKSKIKRNWIFNFCNQNVKRMFRFRKSFFSFRYIHNFNILTHYFCNCKSSKITLSIIFRSIRKKILSSLSLYFLNISSKRLTIIVHVKICRNIIRSLNKQVFVRMIIDETIFTRIGESFEWPGYSFSPWERKVSWKLPWFPDVAVWNWTLRV